MKLLRHFLVASVATLAFTGITFSATYVVSVNNPAATDGGPGSSAVPFKTIKRGIAAAQPGDTIVVQDGIYRENNIVINKSGTSSLPIRLLAAGSDVIIRGSFPTDNTAFQKVSGTSNVYSLKFTNFAPNRVVETNFSNWKPRLVQDVNGVTFSLVAPVAYASASSIGTVDQVQGSFLYDAGSQTLYVHTFDSGNPSLNNHGIELGTTDDGLLFLKDADFVSVDGFQIQFSNGILVHLSDNSQILNCELLAAPFILQFSSSTTVDSVLIDNTANRGPTFDFTTQGSGTGFLLLEGSQNKIRNVTVKRGWNGFDIVGQPGVPTNHLLENVALWGFPNHALTTKNLDTATFKNLRIWNAQDAVLLSGCKNLNIYNSVFYDDSVIQASSSNIKFRNNILFGFFLFLDSSFSGFNSDYNLFLRPANIYTVSGSTYNTLPEIRTAFGIEQNSIQTTDISKQFVNFVSRIFENNDYSLKLGSDAINKGDPSFPVPSGGGTRIDIGAIEFTQTIIAPLAPQNLRRLP